MEFFIIKYIIQMYKSQQKTYLMGLINEIKKEDVNNKKNNKMVKKNLNNFKNYTPDDLQDLEIIDYYQIAFQVWNNLIHIQFQITQELDGLYKKFQRIFETNAILPNQNKFKIQKERIVVFDALKVDNLKNYDFYCENSKTQKLRDIDRFLYDLLEYTIRLARTMSKNLGFFKQNEKKQTNSKMNFFMMMLNMGLRSFQLVSQQVQKFFIAADLYQVQLQLKDFYIQISTL
ncbi:unnamed protein product [Paramecium pentaurelia]|uniref:Uncharacterized protein n=1 Tax=Paramecium pentaurelia TaxID=43138 RepID=A0A8S1X469_9CILI|nr:unnamed protein product [Paramecium pentaurelia]